jgi:hypothetical protein
VGGYSAAPRIGAVEEGWPEVNLFDFPNASAPAPGQPSSTAPIRGAAE